MSRFANWTRRLRHYLRETIISRTRTHPPVNARGLNEASLCGISTTVPRQTDCHACTSDRRWTLEWADTGLLYRCSRDVCVRARSERGNRADYPRLRDRKSINSVGATRFSIIVANLTLVICLKKIRDEDKAPFR